MNELWKRPPIRLWLAIAGAATLVLGAAYVMAQQSTRLAANDLPLATAQTVEHQLDHGATPQQVIPQVNTDLVDDTTVFVTVTDNSSKIVASSARLDDKALVPPSGVFDYTKVHGLDHFTWQPEPNARLATYVLKYANGYIITGQSLKQAEQRINEYTVLTATVWLAMLAWTFLLLVIPNLKKK